MTRAFTYPDGRTMRAGVRADGSYLDTMHGRTALALDTRAGDVQAAVELFRDWAGVAITATDVRRIAHLIGCGLEPNAAAAREYGYRMGLGARGRIFAATAPHAIGL